MKSGHSILTVLMTSLALLAVPVELSGSKCQPRQIQFLL